MNDQTNKQLTFFRFEDLRIYHKALEYVLWVRDITTGLRPIDCLLADDFCKAAQRIAINIAEGSAREKSQFITHLKEAKSAIRACLVLATLAHKQHLISDIDEEESRHQLMEMTKMLGALITSLQKNLPNMQEQYDEDMYPSKNW